MVEAQSKLAEQSMYRTCGDKPEELQVQYLKALDFADEITDYIRIYNVCRAKDYNGCTCGLMGTRSSSGAQ